MSRSRQIAINAVSQWGLTILSAVLGLVLVPFLIAKLGKDGYGLIAVTMAIAGVCMLADLGISGALGRQLAEALAKKNNDKYRELLSGALGLNLLAGLVCALVVFLLARPLAESFGLPQSLFGTGVFLLRTYGTVHVLCTFLIPAPKAILASHNRFDTSSQIEAGRRLLETAGLFLVLSSTSTGITGWAVVCVISDVVCIFLLWRAATKVHVGLRVGISMVRLSSIRELLGLGSQFTLLQLSGQLSARADPFILTTCLGAASVSLYRPPADVRGAITSIVMAISTQLHPLATKAHSENNAQDLKEILFRGTKYTMLLGAMGCGVLIPVAEPLCRVWLGGALSGEYQVCASLLVIGLVGSLFAFAAGSQWPVLLGVKKTAFAAIGRFSLAIVNIIASWVLVRHTDLGVIGVLVPTMIIEVLWRPVLAAYTCTQVGVQLRDYFRQAYQPAILAGGAVAAVTTCLRLYFDIQSVLALVGVSALSCVAALPSLWLIGLNKRERITIRHLLPSLRMM